MRNCQATFLVLVCLAAALGNATADAAGDVILRAGDASIVRGTWSLVPDGSAAGGSRLSNPDQGLAKSPALSNPPDYFELTFPADAATPYHLWIRGRAQNDSYENDSVYIQFSDSVSSDGASVWRIGSASATSVVLEDCSGCGVSGWGWQDNNYGGLASPIYFAGSGPHTIRVQVREDGLSIDQIVLSAGAYLTAAPGSPTNDTTVLIGGSPPPPQTSLVRGPYLQQVRDRSAVIMWASREPGPASVQVGGQSYPASTTFFGSSSTGIADYFQHEATITGLSPATTYGYQLVTGGAATTSAAWQLRTAPSTGDGRIRFVVFGDSGTGSPEQAALASRMTLDTFDLALHAGDIAYGNPGGTGAATYATYQSWFFDVYRGWLPQRPVFPSMGNHDSRPDNSWGQAFLDLFSVPGDAGSGSFPDHGERYYSFDYGPVHFVALDTEFAFQDPDRRAAQLAWLDADLAAAAYQPWKVAFFHRSPYSSGGEHGSDLAVRQAFGPLFEKHGVQLSLSAHEHIYERTVPWRTGVSTGQAVTYIVSGGGGGPLYPAGADEWTAASLSEHHYLRVTVDGCVATIEAVHATGAILDASTLDRCAQASDSAPPAVDFSNVTPGMTLTGVASIEASASDDVGVEKVDLWVDGRVHSIDRRAPYAFAWDTAGVAAGPHTLELRAYDVDGNRAIRSTVVDTGGSAGGSDGLPSGWQSQDIGAVGLTGSASYASGAFTVTAAGADIWGSADAFRYTFQSLTGDGAIVARVSGVSGTDPWTKVGVMIRASTAPDAAHASMFVSFSKGLAFQRRTTTGGLSTHTAGPADPAPQWVMLSRSGQVLTASVSPDGQRWTVVGSDTVVMPADVLIGLAVTSHTTSASATGVIEGVSIGRGQPLPSGWRSDDIGAVGIAGASSESTGTITVAGAGADVWGTADAFHFRSRTLQGNGEIVARVVSVSGADPWTKVGVMLRATLDPSSPHAFMLLSSAKGVAYQRRTLAGGVTTHTGAGSAAQWVKLSRSGQVITASISADGSTWSEVGHDTFPLGETLQAGLAVTSHDASQLASGTFTNVTVTPTP